MKQITLFVKPKNCPTLRLMSIVHSDALTRKFMNDKPETL